MKTLIYTSIHRLRKVAATLLLAAILLPGLTLAQDLTIVSPNGGETFTYGSTITVEWQNNGVSGDLMLEYTDNGGTYWYLINYVIAGDSATSLTFQNNFISPSELCKFRINAIEDPTIGDESDDYFTVVESPVYFSSPYFGDRYYRNQPIYISWFSFTLNTFDVDYSLDNGANWNSLVSDYSGFDYTWTAPDEVSDEVVIRVADASDPNIFGLSPVFSIVDAPEIYVTSPNGGETWTYGGNAEITWTGSNLPTYLYVDFSYDGGATWSNQGYGYSEPGGGSAVIYVPYVNTESALVKVYDPNFPQIFDQSDNVFTVYVPPVIVLSPYEGQVVYNTSDIYTNWMTMGVELLNIEISSDNGQTYSLIAENIAANLGYYNFTLNTTPSETCVLRLTDASDPSKYGLSPVFTVLEAPVITLTSPVGGEIFNTETPYTISWLYDNPESFYIYLDYTTDNGETWNFITYALNDGTGGSFEWTTPLVNSEECYFRVSDFNLQFVKDTSPVFTILTYPQTPICMVSVDSATNRNMIIWEKPVSDLIDQFIVYKESNEANIYEVLGTVDYDSPALITDTNSNPSIKSYRYKLGFSDSEGQVFPMGDFHQTMHLTINQGVGNSWNLIWSDYLGFEVLSYNIYRKSENGSYAQIASISASFNSYTDLGAPAGNVYYIIEVVNPNGCNVASRADEFGSAWSNVATNSTLGFGDQEQVLNVSVYPNPANDQINLLAAESLSGNLAITLNNLLGSKVYEGQTSDLRPGMRYTINSENLRDGIYILKVSSEKGSFTGKVIVRH